MLTVILGSSQIELTQAGNCSTTASTAGTPDLFLDVRWEWFLGYPVWTEFDPKHQGKERKKFIL